MEKSIKTSEKQNLIDSYQKHWLELIIASDD